MNTFGILYDFYIYDKTARESLKKNLTALGYKYTESQMGGGGEVVVNTITVAWIHIEPLFGILLTNILAASIYDVMKKLWAWHQNQKIVNTKYKPEVRFTINFGFFKKRNIYLNFRLDNKITKKDIVKQIKNSKNQN